MREGPLASAVGRIGERARRRQRRPRPAGRRCSNGSSTAPSSPPTRPRRRADRSSTCCAGSPTRSRPSRTRAAPPPTDPGSSAASPSSSTCSGRPTSCASQRPEPTDEARTAIYYLHTRSPSGSCPTCSPSSTARSRRSASSCLRTARPLRFGAWAGGDRDGNPNVTPAGHARGPRPAARRRPARPRRARRGPARRAVLLDPRRHGHRRAAPQPRAPTPVALPITYDALKRLNAEEPYRLKLSFVRVRLLRTRDRLAHGTARTSRVATTRASTSCSPTSRSCATRCSPAATS